MAKIREMAAKTRCVLAPNMSVGVNVMFKVLEYVTGIVGEDFDIEIIEAHHNLKKDAPSGTAMKMAQIIAATLKRDLDKEAVYERKGMIGARTKSKIGIQTIRAGDIVGEHWIIYGGRVSGSSSSTGPTAATTSPRAPYGPRSGSSASPTGSMICRMSSV